ncbi:three-Cys-motif partner protein TcmP [Flaviaesturariibacter amylovorans]|uniref:GMT-like wHTH domain-containing protein n=1 Tax=Flaviaesturariibacter amylovorans TaxID=1084520 RepID=A0ABP8HAW1_9BACT
MAVKDLHEKPFDQGTIAKLEIFQDYAKAWLPTFVMRNRPKVCVFDFFAGTGYDKEGTPGSPIRTLQTIREQLHEILPKGIKVHVHLNEFEPTKSQQRKFEALKQACEEFLDQNKDLRRATVIHYHNEDCGNLFPRLLSEMNEHPSLVYMDQNGVKFLADQYFLELEKQRETDFLYFASSSYIWRLGETPEFQQLGFDVDELKKGTYSSVHRGVIEQLRRRIPPKSPLRLYPFSLKKGKRGENVFGIIFGATHPRAVDKFLAISWKRNVVNGEADYDIDGDAKKVQTTLFDVQPLTKIQKFKENVKAKLLAGEITDNFGLLEFAYEEGHIPAHAAEVAKELKAAKRLDYEGTSPLVTYDNVYKNPRPQKYVLAKAKTAAV